MTGADAEAVRRLAARCTEAAGQIDTLARSLRSRLYSAGWDGPDAQAFLRNGRGGTHRRWRRWPPDCARPVTG